VTPLVAKKVVTGSQQSRTITAAEVGEWFRSSKTRAPSAAICEEVAAWLTRMRGPSDPEDDRTSLDSATQPIDDDRWWDFDSATKAAKILIESGPKMLKHWDGLRWAPETRPGYEAIDKLGEALAVALPYIEFPFGQCEPALGRKKPKDWHVPAVLIFGIIVKALGQSFGTPRLSRNAVMVRVVRSALLRIGYENVKVGTISQHLTRWNAKYGLPGLSEHKAS